MSDNLPDQVFEEAQHPVNLELYREVIRCQLALWQAEGELEKALGVEFNSTDELQEFCGIAVNDPDDLSSDALWEGLRIMLKADTVYVGKEEEHER